MQQSYVDMPYTFCIALNRHQVAEALLPHGIWWLRSLHSRIAHAESRSTISGTFFKHPPNKLVVTN